ncbi:MAG TPA: slipin family protein, partial [Burkholderiaceae bacterium]
ARLPIGQAVGCVKQVSIPAGAFGLLFVEDEFCDYLAPGRHAYFDVLSKTRLTPLRESQVISNKDVIYALQAGEHPAAAAQFSFVATRDKQLAVWWHEDALVAVTGPAERALGGKALRHEIVDLGAAPQPLAQHIALALRRGRETAALAVDYVFQCEIPSEHVGLLHVDGVFADALQPGFYSYWHGGKRLSLTTVDSRLSVIEISGQEMLTQDKVPLRVNVTAGYQIVDARKVTANLNDYKDFIYKEIQFALRAAIGAKTLDGLLENKNVTDEQILAGVREKTTALGIEVVSTGIKDLILPGEIKALLSKVVEAEKAAQANVIRRREETAATRSLMNTSRVMEDNPVALRLKELETLEKITEKIDSISVYGGLESVLKQIAAFKPAGAAND